MSTVKKPPSAVSRLLPLLSAHSLTGLLVPSADAHQSEYVAACDLRRAFISGFTGSAGTALVLNPAAVSSSPTPPSLSTHKLWTDGRYFLQASQQLSGEWELMRQGLPGAVKMEDWILREMPEGSRLGLDASTMSVAGFKALRDACKGRVEIVPTEQNLVDLVWGSERPPLPSAPVIVHGEEWAGESIGSKVSKVRAKLKDSKCSALVVTALDEVAWLLNLRGSDVEYNPVFLSFLVLTLHELVLYVDLSKITPEVKAHLGDAVALREYSAFLDSLPALLPQLSASARVLLDANRCNQAIYSAFPESSHVLLADSPITLLKSVKNVVELAGVRQAHLRDSAAMCRFLQWLEDEVEREDARLTECSISERLAAFRAEQPHFMGLSFSTIAGSGSNGAIIHYHPLPDSCAAVNKQRLLLLDSGGQYRDGTTDITRTLHLGVPTAFQRLCFTRVLQGHIALASVTFPPGTVGPSLDVLARLRLWQCGLDYSHGTGHGVGAFLNVHEGPMGISASVRSASMLNSPLQPGNVITNEPGYYHHADMQLSSGQKEEAFGIRIENVGIVVERETPQSFEGRRWLGFDTVSLTPISRKLMDVGLLSQDERRWVDDFHAQCRQQVAPLLDGKPKDWLMRETEPLPVPGQ